MQPSCPWRGARDMERVWHVLGGSGGPNMACTPRDDSRVDRQVSPPGAEASAAVSEWRRRGRLPADRGCAGDVRLCGGERGRRRRGRVGADREGLAPACRRCAVGPRTQETAASARERESRLSCCGAVLGDREQIQQIGDCVSRVVVLGDREQINIRFPRPSCWTAARTARDAVRRGAAGTGCAGTGCARRRAACGLRTWHGMRAARLPRYACNGEGRGWGRRPVATASTRRPCSGSGSIV